MSRVLRIIALLLGGVVVIALIAAVAIFGLSRQQLNKVYTFNAEPLAIPTDEEAVARGEYLVSTRGCKECHGDNLAGTAFIADPAFATLHAPNLTRGEGSPTAAYEDQDWVNALRYGGRPNGTSFLIMPASEYYHFTDSDLGAIIAYLKTVPQVDQSHPARSLGPIGSMLVATNQLPLQAALIPTDGPTRPAVPPGPTAEYGEYVAVVCTGCHGLNLRGSTQPSSNPPLVIPSLAAAGEWSQEEFVTALTTGVRPDGSMLDPEEMPINLLAQLEEDELIALHAYISSLPAEGRPSTLPAWR